MTSPASRRVLLAGFPSDLAAWLGGRLPGVIVATAATGGETLAALRGGEWAAAVIDQELAGPPGLDVVEAIRTGAGQEALPVLFCFSPESSRELPESLAHPPNATRVLPHPLDREAVARELVSLLGVNLPPPARPGTAASAAIAKIWERFRGVMFERLAAVEEAARAAAEGQLSEGPRRQGEREAHKLVGALGTYGLMEGSRIAREIEDLLEGSATLPPGAAGRLASLGVSLRQVMEEFGVPPPSSGGRGVEEQGE